MTSVMSEGNVVTVPPEVVEKLGITPGTKLEWEIPDGKIGEARIRVIYDRAKLIQELRGCGRKYLKPGDDPIRELIEERIREDEEEEAQGFA